MTVGPPARERAVKAFPSAASAADSGAAAAASPASSVVVVCGVAPFAGSVAGGAVRPAAFLLHWHFAALRAGGLALVFAGASDVLVPVWSRACPAVACISGRDWDCPCSAEPADREVYFPLRERRVVDWRCVPG